MLQNFFFTKFGLVICDVSVIGDVVVKLDTPWRIYQYVRLIFEKKEPAEASLSCRQVC